MRNVVEIARTSLFRSRIPLFAGKPAHLSVPLEVGRRRSGDRQAYRYAVLAGALAVCTGSTVSTAQSAQVAHQAAVDPYATHIIEASLRFQIPAAWIRAILRAESHGDPRAISPKGAMGLMQIMPETWASLRVRHQLGGDAFDPHDNIIAGAGYIRELFDRYGSPGWIVAYNAGPARYEGYRDKGHPLPAETRTYVAALAPIVASDLTFSVTVATADKPAWTRAPLFVVQADSGARVDRPRNDNTSAAQLSPHSGDNLTPTDPQTGHLFVVRSADARSR